MATVNWEREPGEKVEEFVAALLLLKYPHGNLITPSQGDRGVDVRVWNPDGFDIYQVKRYTRPLDSTQEKEVKKSWQTFVDQTLPILKVRSWTLVTPLNPSNERLDWLDALTEPTGLETHWMDRGALDGLAGNNYPLVDYFFGDGAQHWHRLMADLLDGVRPLPGDGASESLLSAIASRQEKLARSLDEVDPFYRYEIDIRTGWVENLPLDSTRLGETRAAFIQYAQIDDEHYREMRLLPRCAESVKLRPITADVRLEADPGTSTANAIHRFRQFGTPFSDVPGTITAISGPPGVPQTGGPATFSFLSVPQPKTGLPDLCLRIREPNGQKAAELELEHVSSSRGQAGSGVWVSASDRAQVLNVEFTFGGDSDAEFRLRTSGLKGKTPAEVLPAVRATAELRTGRVIELAVRGGLPITGGWELERDDAEASLARWHVAFLEALTTIQEHTYHRITVPDVTTMTPPQRQKIFNIAGLLRGEQIEEDWSEVTTDTASAALLESAGPEFSFGGTAPLTVELDGQEIHLNMARQTHYESARIRTGQPDSDVIHLVPGSSTKAVSTAVPLDQAAPAPQ
ncbi:restriction endonuclease [Cryptosporangium phraense]|uniref:Restriction endonuclease n=1 Tax=Cryptosporangium phraense TaxID=2593070 RepID=A0A545AUT8_9ACTN|nr:restriction endonuclease [Cryptosporangium phraense]TQS45096.1 restriction endonuclease [Cryptosporangium phraense]